MSAATVYTFFYFIIGVDLFALNVIQAARFVGFFLPSSLIGAALILTGGDKRIFAAYAIILAMLGYALAAPDESSLIRQTYHLAPSDACDMNAFHESVREINNTPYSELAEDPEYISVLNEMKESESMSHASAEELREKARAVHAELKSLPLSCF
jgi:hypothetical protein